MWLFSLVSILTPQNHDQNNFRSINSMQLESMFFIWIFFSWNKKEWSLKLINSVQFSRNTFLFSFYFFFIDSTLASLTEKGNAIFKLTLETGRTIQTWTLLKMFTIQFTIRISVVVNLFLILDFNHDILTIFEQSKWKLFRFLFAIAIGK